MTDGAWIDHPYTGDPLSRWKIGHHAFFPLTQVISIGLARFGRAVAAKDSRMVACVLRGLADVLSGSSVAMRFAADFTKIQYDTIVRLDMASRGEGFSGSYSADHTYMLRRFQLLRQTPKEASGAYNCLLAAVDATYLAHANVCEKFVGLLPSLSQGEDSGEAGGAALRGKFRNKALRQAGCPMHR